MNSNPQIMNDNILYLNEWMNYNESLRGNLQIVGSDLVCNINGKNESIDISDYYLPDILYNPLLREQIQDKDKISAEDLFRIIRVNVLAEALDSLSINTDQELFITKMEKLQDANGQTFLSFEDNYGHKFKMVKNIEVVLQVYQKLLQTTSPVPVYVFKNVLEAMKRGENL